MEEPSNDSTRVRSLSDFPEHLLLHILSFLPTLDAIQTSFVCRKWRHLWSSLPFLHFSHTLFPSSNSPSETRRSFTDFVDRTLILRSLFPLLQFHLQFDYAENRYASHVDSWIRYAIAHNVLDLDLDFFEERDFEYYDDDHDDDDHVYYSFPFSVLRNGRVRVLKLSCCDLSLPTNMSVKHFFSLRSMSLCKIYLTDQMVSDILKACVNLEALHFEHNWGMKDVKIFSSKLRKLSLKGLSCDEGSVEIYAPNLCSLNIVCFQVGKYTLRGAVSLVEANVALPYYSHWSKVVRLLGHVHRLAVGNRWFELLASKNVPSERFVLHNLKFLDLWTGYSNTDMLGVAALLERSPNLEMMTINYCFKLCIGEKKSSAEELFNVPINFSSPSLREVKIKSFKGTAGELRFVRLLEKQGAVLEKIVLVPAKGCEISLDGLKELKLSKDILHIQQF
ncbi:hypothetical protein L1049_023970 [Liquidambar formosana]|uniref:F-box domain-containing protein n=1 Tax=Liquidambar formosana TaxID=63359 RepID=A0AAP0RTQ2_LIQFO